LSLELSGELLPPQELHDSIKSDLIAIRKVDPNLTSIHRPQPAPFGEFEVTLTDSAWTEYKSGAHHGLDALNAQYGPVTVTVEEWRPGFHLQFEKPYEPHQLAKIYETAPGVRWAEPEWGLVGSGPTIVATLPQYQFLVGWGDCLAGCIHWHWWTYSVVDGRASLVEEAGEPIPGPDVDPETWIPTPAIVLGTDGAPMGTDFVPEFEIVRGPRRRQAIPAE